MSYIQKFLHRLKAIIQQYLLDRRAYKFFIKDWILLKDLEISANVIKTMRFSRKLTPLLQDNPKGNRILIVAPHPDDEILGPGGTIIKSIAAGMKVMCIYLTNGDSKDESDLKIQSEAVSKKVGFQVYRFGFNSGHIPINKETLSKFARQINSYDPHVLFLPILLDDHDDHRRVSHLLWEAYRQGLFNRKEIEIWSFGIYTPNWPNVIVDITDVAGKKVEALKLYENQMKSFDWAHMVTGLNAFNSRFLKTPTPKFIETFFVVPLKDYIELCDIYFSNKSDVYYSPNYCFE